MGAPLPDCCVNYMLIKFVPYCHVHVQKYKSVILNTNFANNLDI